MNVKAYFSGQNSNFITIEINNQKIEGIPLGTAIDRYAQYDIVLSEIEKCCMQGDKNSIQTWNRYKGLVDRLKSMSELDEDEDDRGHTEHKTLEEILDSVKDSGVRKEIEQVLAKYEGEYGQNIQYLAEGGESTVFSVGDKVIKFGGVPQIEDIPFTLPVYDAVQYDTTKIMRVFQKARIWKVSREELQTCYNDLRASGYVWHDVEYDNVGWIENEGEEQLRVIDDIDIKSEEEVLSEYSSVLEFLQLADPYSSTMFEMEYQRTHNPEFNIDRLGDYFHNYNNSFETQISVSILQIQFEAMCQKQLSMQGNRFTLSVPEASELTHYGERAYEHFGEQIAPKLEEALSTLKNIQVRDSIEKGIDNNSKGTLSGHEDFGEK